MEAKQWQPKVSFYSRVISKGAGWKHQHWAVYCFVNRLLVLMAILMTQAVYSLPLSFLIQGERERNKMGKKNVKGNDYLRVWESGGIDCKKELRLTMHFSARGTLNCCSLHHSGHLENRLGRSQHERRVVRHQRWNLGADLFDQSWPELHYVDSPITGNDSVLIGFFQTPQSATCMSLGCPLVSSVSLFRLSFFIWSESISIVDFFDICESCHLKPYRTCLAASSLLAFPLSAEFFQLFLL